MIAPPDFHYTQPADHIERSDCSTLIELALAEDLPAGDVTSDPLFTDSTEFLAAVVSREEGVLAGMPVLEILLDVYQERYRPLAPPKLKALLQEGQSFGKGERLLELRAGRRDLLRLERTLLNFLQYLSGIATAVRKAQSALPEGIVLLDTRKTLPGYRKLAKYAVCMGGGSNHRLNLSEMAMLKDNHIAAAGSISAAVGKIRALHPGIKLEIEIDRLDQLTEALACEPDVLLLDNMDVPQIQSALDECEARRARVFIEISGNWTPARASELAGLQRKRPIGISMGAITHTTRFLDLSLEM